MKQDRRALAGRDQRASVFSATLLRLCDALGAVAAALVDAEGETVDYAGRTTPFEIKVAAAEWAILLSLLRSTAEMDWFETQQVLLRGTRKSFFVQLLDQGYALVIQLPLRAFSVSRRGLAEAVRELCTEAGFPLPPALLRESEHWRRTEVRCDRHRTARPSAIWADGGWVPVEILGRWETADRPPEVGYLARLPTGQELMLVREGQARWYLGTPTDP